VCHISTIILTSIIRTSIAEWSLCTPGLNTKINFENTFMPTVRNLLLSPLFHPFLWKSVQLNIKKTANVRINVISGHVCETIDAVDKQ